MGIPTLEPQGKENTWTLQGDKDLERREKGGEGGRREREIQREESKNEEGHRGVDVRQAG